MTPDRITIRSYQVGFGDAFLVSFRYPGAEPERHVLIDFGSTGLPGEVPKDRMDWVARDVAERSGGKLTAVVATHRHKDHISGFATRSNGKGPGDVIRKLAPDLVVQPWTEDPDLPPDAPGPGGTDAPSPHKGMQRTAHALAAMQMVSGHVHGEASHVSYLGAQLKEEITFLGDDNISNRAAVENLMTMGPNEYSHCGKPTALEGLLPGVAVHVLGPPTITQTETVRKQRSRDAEEFWQLRAAAGQVAFAGRPRPAPLYPRHVIARGDEKMPIENRWLIYKARNVRSSQMLRIVRELDKVMNNTSLILLFEVGGKSLLFPGDAQIENWRYALDQPDIRERLKNVDVYKVGHHGSLNATPKSLWELFEHKNEDPDAPDRLTSVMSTMQGKHGSEKSRTEVPRRTLVDALEKESRLVSTEHVESADKPYHEIVIDLTPA